MNKVISFILLCAVLLTCLTGCAYIEKIFSRSHNVDDGLIATLSEYLQGLHAEHAMPKTSVETKINDIKNGQQPLHVAFDPSNYYFICAYYNSKHEHESRSYCCTEKYTWVKFQNADEIQKYYSGKKLFVAFQINKALFIRDISQENVSVPEMEHFQLYEPRFEGYFNANGPIIFNETFIYLNKSSDPFIYHATTSYFHNWVAFPCVKLDRQYYITIPIYEISPKGWRNDIDPAIQCGAYYNALANIMIRDRYKFSTQNGITVFCGLLEINEFVNAVIK